MVRGVFLGSVRGGARRSGKPYDGVEEEKGANDLGKGGGIRTGKARKKVRSVKYSTRSLCAGAGWGNQGIEEKPRDHRTFKEKKGLEKIGKEDEALGGGTCFRKKINNGVEVRWVVLGKVREKISRGGAFGDTPSTLHFCGQCLRTRYRAIRWWGGARRGSLKKRPAQKSLCLEKALQRAIEDFPPGYKGEE